MALKDECKTLRVGAAQFDAVAGNIAANAAVHERLIDEAGGLGVEVLVFPELSLPGYASSVLDAWTKPSTLIQMLCNLIA